MVSRLSLNLIPSPCVFFILNAIRPHAPPPSQSAHVLLTSGHPSYIPLATRLLPPCRFLFPRSHQPQSFQVCLTNLTPALFHLLLVSRLDPTSMMQQFTAFQTTGAHGVRQYVACMMYYWKKNSSWHVSCTSRHLLPQLTNLFCRFEGPQAAERPLLWICFILIFSNNHHWLS